MGELRRIEPQLIELGYQVLAVSADSPENLSRTKQEHRMQYQLLSDPGMRGAIALGIAWQVDKESRRKYKGFGVDLEEASGAEHHLLPVPAAFVIGTDGRIDFSYINPDHRGRVPTMVLLKAAEEAMN